MQVYSISYRKQQPDMLEEVMISSMSPAAEDDTLYKKIISIVILFDNSHYLRKVQTCILSTLCISRAYAP